MSVLEIVTGPMRAGKTTYAKQTGAEYLCLDTMLEKAGYDFNRLAQSVAAIWPMRETLRQACQFCTW